MRLKHQLISSFAWNSGHLALFYICFLVIVPNVPLMAYGKKCWSLPFLEQTDLNVSYVSIHRRSVVLAVLPLYILIHTHPHTHNEHLCVLRKQKMPE